MTINVSIANQGSHTFTGVEALTFHSGNANITGQPVAQWTKYQEEGRGSEELVNIDLEQLSLEGIAIIRGELCAFATAQEIGRYRNSVHDAVSERVEAGETWEEALVHENID